MKIPYALTLALAAAVGTAHAQTPFVAITDAQGALVNGTVLHVNADLTPDPFQILSQALLVTNTSGVARTINVKRVELDVLPGTQNYFCWFQCYDPIDAGFSPVWTSPQPIAMAAGEEWPGFYGDYMPKGISGSNTMRYIWFDVDQPSMADSVDVVFTAAEPSGVAELAHVRGFSVYPNPSVGGNINLDYDLAASGARLSIYNLLGERKLVKNLGAAQGRVVLGSADLGNGVWFAVIERNGKALATKRLVIAR